MAGGQRKVVTVAAGLAVLAALNWVAARASRRRRYANARLGRLESRWYGVRGLRLHALASAELAGAEPAGAELAGRGLLPVVLVHGLGVSSRYMVPIAHHLAADLPVYAPDLPGFGRSDKPRHALTIRQLADALADWMDAAGLERAVLLGNSMGCEIIVELALRHPERVAALVLQGPTPEPAARTAAQQLWRYAVTGQYERSPLSWISLSDYMICGVRRLVRTFRYMLEDRIEDKLPLVRQPCLVVRGTRDRIVSQEWADEVARLLPDGRLAVIPGAAHAINFSYPREFKTAILPFLLAQSAQAPPVARPRERMLARSS
jgi:2-hydroxy-6-oxonona-2,4-dienedioate hydrolase